MDGKSIFLVGMMGSGKSTVGKILSEALGYYFFDSDHLIEQAAGGTPVAQIFKEKDEEFFRDAESKVLSELSTMHRLVVATGGCTVVRPENWNYLNHGVTVWLDVPLEALAKRVVAVGTESRPLLGQASVDPYTQAFARLTELIEKRGKAYGNSNAKVSLQKIAAELGFSDVSDLTPTTIAIEVLKEIAGKQLVGEGFTEEKAMLDEDGKQNEFEKLRVKCLRLAHRLGQSSSLNVVVTQVLHRLEIAERLWRNRNFSKSGGLPFEFQRESAIAEQQEASGQGSLEFTCTIMLLGITTQEGIC